MKIKFSFYMLFIVSLQGLEFTQHQNNSQTLNAIMASGEIKHDDAEKLDKYLSYLPKKKHSAIYFNSPGGNLLGGIRLGKYFKINGIKTVIQGDSICASACALAFLGGTDYKGNKWMSSTTTSLLGFHAFSRGDGTRYADSDLTQQIVAEILKYGHYVNAPTEIFIRQFSTPSSEMYWFTKQEELDFGIKVWDVDNNLFLPIKERIYSTSILIHQSSISFVRKYFSDIKKVPYRQTWNMLSKRMKRKISLQQYIHWWDKKVQKVTIENIRDISSKEIEVKLQYRMKNGERVCSLDTISLQNANKQWLIENQRYRNCPNDG